MNTTKQELINEMLWATEMLITTGEPLGITYYEANKLGEKVNRQLEEAYSKNAAKNNEHTQIHQEPSNISFNQ